MAEEIDYEALPPNAGLGVSFFFVNGLEDLDLTFLDM